MPRATTMATDSLLSPADPAPPASDKSARRTAERTKGTGRAVLVVESTPIARKFLALRLSELGYDVESAESGDEALERIERRAFAIVFLELTLGPSEGLDGLQLCQAIKQKPDHPMGLVPAVVVVTGQSGSSDRVRATLAGCDAFIAKPIVDAKLIQTLSEVDGRFA